MPAAKRAATLNLGMQTVTVAVFEATGESGLSLSKLERAGLVPDPSTDGSRSGQLGIALKEISRKLRWSGGLSGLCIPSQGVFARFLKIPNVDAAQAAQMLSFEAQQTIPYPIEEVSWTYQVLPDPDQSKLGALVLAARYDQLEPDIEAATAAGFWPDVVESSPTALYNCLRYNYPELSGCTLLVDIGARATNLVFAEDDRVFVRTLPVGGNAITIALHKRFETRSVSEVEDLKVKSGFIAAAGNTQAPDLESGEAGKIARTVMTRIHNEITRSITFYRTTQNGSNPVRILLAGGGSRLPYTLEFFNEKLSLPIEFFNPLRRVSVAPALASQMSHHAVQTLGECVGLATRLLIDDCPLEVNFGSRAISAKKRERARLPFLLGSLLVAAGIVSAAYLYYTTAANRTAELSAAADGKSNGLQEAKRSLDRLASERDKDFAEAANLVGAPRMRTAWATILDEISQKMPTRQIWVTKLRPVVGDSALEPTESGGNWLPAAADGNNSRRPVVTAISIQGLYLENDSGPAVVDAFIESLAGSEVFAIQPDKKAEAVRLRAAQTGESWAYAYELILPLKRPLPL